MSTERRRRTILAQSTTFVPGAREIYHLDLETILPSGLPVGVSVPQGKATAFARGGLPAIKASEPTELLIRLPRVLPDSLALAFDIGAF